MAAAELGKSIKQTQNLLGKYVKKPPLSEKNLSRPPFRFLHDVTTSVINGTGFMNGVFDAQELDSDNITSREAKTEFMSKLIAAVSEATGEEMPVKISKILSGQEPEKTNMLLQALSRAIQKSKATPAPLPGKAGVVAPVKAKPTETNKGAKHTAPVSDNKKQTVRNEQGGLNKTGDGPSSNTVKPGKAPVKAKASSSNSSESNRMARPAVPPGRKNSFPRETEESKPNKPTAAAKQSNSDVEKKKDDNFTASLGNDQPLANKESALDSSVTKMNSDIGFKELASGDRGSLVNPELQQNEFDNRDVASANKDSNMNGSMNDAIDPPQTSKQLVQSPSAFNANSSGDVASNKNRINTARPPSARPAPPRPRSSIFRDTEESNYRPPTGKVTNVLLDNLEMDEDDNFVIREAAVDHGPGLGGVDETPELALATGTKIDVEKALEDLAPGDRGLLVDQILETQKEIENRDGAMKDLESDSSGMGKSRETSKAEIEKLKNLLQECARNANPLGKLLDYVREDIDSMQKEVGKWREESRALDSDLETAKRAAEASLQPIQQQLAEVEARVADKEDAIAATKMSVIRLQGRIEKILSGLDRVKSSHGKITIPSASQLMKNEPGISNAQIIQDGNHNTDKPPSFQRASSGFGAALNRLALSTPGMRPINLFASDDLDPDNFDPFKK